MAVIDEVIYRLDADGEIPVTVDVRPAPDGGVVLALQLADAGEAEITGAAPIVFTAQFGAGITAAMERRQQSSRSEPCAGFWRGTVIQRLAGR